MMSRRNALLAGIGLAGIAAYARNLFALGAHVGVEKFEVSRTEAEWKQVLTPEQFQVLRQRGTERPHSSALTSIAPVCTLVQPAICPLRNQIR
jgi:peptide-methionine (R)-S-oxide reductase